MNPARASVRTQKEHIMWIGVSLSASALIVVCALAGRVMRGRMSSRAIDVGVISAGWLVEHRCDTSHSSSPYHAR
jgi:hypothetical protein